VASARRAPTPKATERSPPAEIHTPTVSFRSRTWRRARKGVRRKGNVVGRNTSARIAGRARRPVAQTQMQCGVRAMLCDAYVARWYVWPSLRSAPAALPLRRQERVRADAVPAACNGFQLGRQHRLQRGKRHDTAGAHCPCWRRSRWRRPRGSTVSPPSAELYSAPATSSTNSAETHPPWARPPWHPPWARPLLLFALPSATLPLAPSRPRPFGPTLF